MCLGQLSAIQLIAKFQFGSLSCQCSNMRAVSFAPSLGFFETMEYGCFSQFTLLTHNQRTRTVGAQALWNTSVEKMNLSLKYTEPEFAALLMVISAPCLGYPGSDVPKMQRIRFRNHDQLRGSLHGHPVFERIYPRQPCTTSLLQISEPEVTIATFPQIDVDLDFINCVGRATPGVLRRNTRFYGHSLVLNLCPDFCPLN